MIQIIWQIKTLESRHIIYNCILFLFFFGSFQAQTIKGKIQNSYGQLINSAYVVVKDSINSPITREFVVVRNGNYLITLKEEYSSVVIIATANGYDDDYFVMDYVEKEKTYVQNFKLKESVITELKEVVLFSNKKPIEVKKDTVIYNVSSFRDGSERKVEDLLKKLPGIEVNENSGEIKYKGKKVETVTLDGDNLFDSNYSIGTKNINIDIVEQIQAIENYSENVLLKNIVDEDKVALNLKLKKVKVTFQVMLILVVDFYTK